MGVEEPPAQLVSSAIAVRGATRYLGPESSIITISFLQLRNRCKHADAQLGSSTNATTDLAKSRNRATTRYERPRNNSVARWPFDRSPVVPRLDTARMLGRSTYRLTRGREPMPDADDHMREDTEIDVVSKDYVSPMCDRAERRG